jgi:hypothetical protein
MHKKCCDNRQSVETFTRIKKTLADSVNWVHLPRLYMLRSTNLLSSTFFGTLKFWATLYNIGLTEACILYNLVVFRLRSCVCQRWGGWHYAWPIHHCIVKFLWWTYNMWCKIIIPSNCWTVRYFTFSVTETFSTQRVCRRWVMFFCDEY